MVANPKFNHEMTVDEFEEFLTLPENHNRHFELIDGIAVEKPTATEAHGVAAGNIHAPIWNYVKETKRGLSFLRFAPTLRVTDVTHVNLTSPISSIPIAPSP